ncbi:hypothetical protein ABZ438_19240 [Streptomyces sp. NPDC005786]|uniref:hypothetical protein n=1 Tax=Streptomyces sp. NPDC005786 TaxID=3154891 RepID=UPI0033C3789D
MSRYDARRGYAPAPVHDRPRLMDFMLPWAAGILVTLVTQLALAVLVWDVITGDDVTGMASPVRTVLLLHLPSAACVALGVWAAAAVHRGASRESRTRHFVAAFTPAVVLQVVIFFSQGSDLTVITFLVQLVVLVAGCAVGFLVDRLRNG